MFNIVQEIKTNTKSNIMKAILNLPICIKNNLKNPTITMDAFGFLVKWEYNKTSYACQGEYAVYQRYWMKENYNYDVATKAVEAFIKSEYSLTDES